MSAPAVLWAGNIVALDYFQLLVASDALDRYSELNDVSTASAIIVHELAERLADKNGYRFLYVHGGVFVFKRDDSIAKAATKEGGAS